jgi:hypothetical protein
MDCIVETQGNGLMDLLSALQEDERQEYLNQHRDCKKLLPFCEYLLHLSICLHEELAVATSIS